MTQAPDMSSSPSAARPGPSERRRIETLTVDVHAHLDTGTDIANRKAALDAMGIDVQCVAPPHAEIARVVATGMGAETANEAVARWVDGDPSRFRGLGVLPAGDGDTAVQALAQCTGALGLSGAVIGATSVAGRGALWQAAEASGAVLMLHPVDDTPLGAAEEVGQALAALVLDGVFTRYPGLKLIATLGGGTAPALAGRLDHAWGRNEATTPEPPSACLRRVFYDTVVFAPVALAQLVRTVGAGQVLMGSDMPGPMADPDPVGLLTGTEALTEAEWRMIGGATAARLFGVEPE